MPAVRYVDYDIKANGWRATGSIAYKRLDELHALINLVVESVVEGEENKQVISESFTSGFSRYLRPIDLDELKEKK